jgi:2'-5' RNA ligase
VPVDVTRELGTLLEPLHLPAAARWVRGAALHVTLVFIGATWPREVPTIAATMEDIASRHAPIRLRLGRAGSFGGGGRPRVAWIGLDAGVPELRDLADELHPRVLRRWTGPPRPLTPHITVARRAADDLVERMDAVLARVPPVEWTADRMIHYRSHLGIGPPMHEQLTVARLGVPAGVAGDVATTAPGEG